MKEHGASIVVSPSPHDVHHGHETVGRGVQRAMAVLPPTLRWWMWGVWGDLPAPNVFYGFDQTVLDRALHILDAYAGELERNDYRPFLTGRASGERRHGLRARLRLRLPCGQRRSPTPSCSPRCACSTAGSWPPSRTSSTRAPSPQLAYDVDLTAWLDSPSVHELVGYIREVRGEAAT